MTFKKGESGNAAGRPKGRKNKSTVLRSKYGALVWEKLFELAMDGDPVALRLIADRVIPKLKPQYQTENDPCNKAALLHGSRIGRNCPYP